jgi:aminomethyltransferase
VATTKTSQSEPLKRTPLYHLALEQKARFTGFAGWEMAVQFSGLKQEHEAVRNEVGMFDISHMGKFIIKGDNVLKILNQLVPSDLENLTPGKAQYTVLLNEKGGIIDDIIVYNTGKNKVTIIVNAATKEKDKIWLLKNLENTDLDFTDLSENQVLIAIQGPKSLAILQSLVTSDLASLTAFSHLNTTIFNSPAFVARTGYTGEDGFEIMLDPEAGQKLWRSLLEKGVTPCGLGSRDTLRLEAAMNLYGQEMDDQTTPLEAGLGWLIHWDRKGDFIGRAALEKQREMKVKRRLVGLQMEDRHIARHGYPVVFKGDIVGEVTSGTLAPTVGKAIALAYVPRHLSKIGQHLEIEIRGKNYPALVVKKPFYRSPNRCH